MKLIIDSEERTLTYYEELGGVRVVDLYTPEAFERISDLWLKVGWDQKYAYTFSWLGRPVIQLPEDMVRTQEVIYQVQPDVIIETGIAHGGSLVYYASLCKVMGKGRIIGIDIEIRPHNRQAIEGHFLMPLITLIEGDSVNPETVARVKSLVKPGEVVMVFLDSCHTRQHVLAELEAYCDLVSPGSYIVATDGIMANLYDVPRGTTAWIDDNPVAAALEFLKTRPGFEITQPEWLFNESRLKQNITYWSSAWIRRRKE